MWNHMVRPATTRPSSNHMVLQQLYGPPATTWSFSNSMVLHHMVLQQLYGPPATTWSSSNSMVLHHMVLQQTLWSLQQPHGPPGTTWSSRNNMVLQELYGPPATTWSSSNSMVLHHMVLQLAGELCSCWCTRLLSDHVVVGWSSRCFETKYLPEELAVAGVAGDHAVFCLFVFLFLPPLPRPHLPQIFWGWPCAVDGTLKSNNQLILQSSLISTLIIYSQPRFEGGSWQDGEKWGRL